MIDLDALLATTDLIVCDIDGCLAAEAGGPLDLARLARSPPSIHGPASKIDQRR